VISCTWCTRRILVTRTLLNLVMLRYDTTSIHDALKSMKYIWHSAQIITIRRYAYDFQTHCRRVLAQPTTVHNYNIVHYKLHANLGKAPQRRLCDFVLRLSKSMCTISMPRVQCCVQSFSENIFVRSPRSMQK
jgi:hypothetical protein